MSVPVEVSGQIIFSAWWGMKSALLHEDSILYKAKMLFIEKLFKAGLASDKDMDRRNMNAHIQLLLPIDKSKEPVKTAKFTINSNESAQDRYDKLQKKQITLTSKSLIINSDHVEIDTGLNTHMTIFFKKGLGNVKNHDLIQKLWNETLTELNKQ
jgi:hypothetical protein